MPLFDAGQLSSYLSQPRHRLFLADLLASFARISGGLVHSTGSARRRRWNDADPARLAVLLDTVPADQRAPVWRRLGDLALFLAGVFPDAAERLIPGQAAAARLARRTGLDPEAGPDRGAPDLLGGSAPLVPPRRRPRPGRRRPRAPEQAEHFRPARRVLNTAADRYLLRPAPAGSPRPADPLAILIATIYPLLPAGKSVAIMETVRYQGPAAGVPTPLSRRPRYGHTGPRRNGGHSGPRAKDIPGA